MRKRQNQLILVFFFAFQKWRRRLSVLERAGWIQPLREGTWQRWTGRVAPESSLSTSETGDISAEQRCQFVLPGCNKVLSGGSWSRSYLWQVTRSSPDWEDIKLLMELSRTSNNKLSSCFILCSEVVVQLTNVVQNWNVTWGPKS